MKKLIIFLFGTLTIGLSIANAEYKLYDNMADFEKEKGAICEAATDGCNNYFMTDGKIAGGTLIYCQDKPVEWSCTKYKEGAMVTKSMPVVDIINSGSITGIVIKIENGKDGVQATILGTDNIEYNTAISVISDKITNGKLSDIVIGAKIKVNYDDKSDNMLFGNSEEIIKSTLTSDNDKNFYNSIKSKLDIDSLRYVNSAIKKYIPIIDKVIKKDEYNKRVIAKLETIITNYLLQFPQDKGLSDRDNTKYLKRSLLKFELQQLKF